MISRLLVRIFHYYYVPYVLNIEFETEYMNSLMIGTFIIDVFPLLISLSGTKLLISDGINVEYYWKKSKEESLSLSLSVIFIPVPIFISNYKISIILNMEIYAGIIIKLNLTGILVAYWYSTYYYISLNMRNLIC